MVNNITSVSVSFNLSLCLSISVSLTPSPFLCLFSFLCFLMSVSELLSDTIRLSLCLPLFSLCQNALVHEDFFFFFREELFVDGKVDLGNRVNVQPTITYTRRVIAICVQGTLMSARVASQVHVYRCIYSFYSARGRIL